MAKKFRIEKLEDVDEADRGLYREATDDDGVTGFVLDVEGAVPLERHAEFRTTNIELYDKDKASTKKIGDLETEISDLQKKLESAGEETEKQVKGKESELAGRLDTLEKAHEEEITKREAAEQESDRVKKRDILKTVGVKGGVSVEASDAFADAYVSQFKLDGDTIQHMTGEIPTASVLNAGKVMEVDEFVQHRSKDASFYFGVNQGDGAGGDGGGRPAVKKIIPNDPVEIGKHMKEIQAGEVEVDGFESTTPIGTS